MYKLLKSVKIAQNINNCFLTKRALILSFLTVLQKTIKKILKSLKIA